MSSATFPLELWLIIADLLTEAIINPADYCNYRNFPQMDHYLRSPTVCSSLITTHRQLRLVCRAFNELFKSSPLFFMKIPIDSIPQGTKALYITSTTEPLGCLDRLLEDPLGSHRISTLDIPCDLYGQINGIPSFDYICSVSHLLPGVRNLSLVIRSGFLDWSRLNKSFFALVILVLRPFILKSEWLPSDSPRETGTGTVFEKLRILDVDQLGPDINLSFPCLRHVAFGNWSWHFEAILSRSPQLESLLVRSAQYGGPYGIDPNRLPGLKLVGLPLMHHGNTLPPLPDFPLHHLCLHMRIDLGWARPLVELAKRISFCMPEVSQITLDLTDASEQYRRYLEGAFRGIDSDLRPSGLVIRQISPSSFHIVIERIVDDSQSGSSPRVSITSQSRGARATWASLRQAASCRMNL